MRDGKPGTDLRPMVAVIGAGVSGLACARDLLPHAQVKLFDKSRGVGGRLSTRYAGAYEFDHGAQYFTTRDAEFADFILQAELAGVVGPWKGRFLYLSDETVEHDNGGARWVGTPRMNALAKLIAMELDIQTGARVSKISRNRSWTLMFEDGSQEGGFAAVVLAVPAPQAEALLPRGFSERRALSQVKMDVCFALMVGMDGQVEFGAETLRAKDLPVDWIAVNSSKPERPDGVTTLMIHSETTWSNRYANADRDWVAAQMLGTASDLLRHDLSNAPHQVLHRWLYSSVSAPVGQDCLLDTQTRLGVCGDWCPGGRVEGAWRSGRAMAKAIIAAL